ncbi:hypothetical protein WME90_29295 [Sorangium sp. So ce375]|uniref:hypothetical protein n=1 Tax=Sorangium sp. So ce375 TaxID=3133306 RepID=UPI003F5B1C48
MSNAILKELQGEMALLYNGDVPNLLRMNGQLVLGDTESSWTPDWLREISEPCTMAKLHLL